MLDPDVAPAWAAQQGIEDTSLEALAADERVRAEIQRGVDDVNAQVSNVEGVKKFTILGEDWLPGGDELTPDDEAEAQAGRARSTPRRSRRCTRSRRSALMGLDEYRRASHEIWEAMAPGWESSGRTSGT